MDTVKVRFLETRVVDDGHRGTALETRFEAGSTYELSLRSADRWVKRGAARFLSEDDERMALGASRTVALDMLDPDRKIGDGEGATPITPRVVGSATGEEAERTAIVERIATTLVAERAGLSSQDWNALTAAEQLVYLQDADAEVTEFVAQDRQRLPDPFDHDADGRPGGSLPRGGVLVGDGGSDTDGDQQGDASPATGPLAETPQGTDFDAMSDEQLRDFIDQRDGRRPRLSASRETLLARAKGDQAL